jgi:hypothetical protein
MIKSLVELYGEAEHFKNYAKMLLDELESIGKGERKRLMSVLDDINKFIIDWELSGLNYLHVGFDPRIEGLLFYASASIGKMGKLLREYNGKNPIKSELKEFIKYLNDLLQHITERYTKEEDIYSNRVLESQFNELLKRYDYFIYLLSREILPRKTIVEKINLDEYNRTEIIDFVESLIDFANGLNIRISPQALYSIIEPLFEKQTYEQYTQHLNIIKEVFEFYINEIQNRFK